MLKIYGVPISVHTRKVIVVALAKGLQHEVVPVVPVVPGGPPPNWRDLSPTGKIPVLGDDDFSLCDSAAICAYMERLRPSPSVYPAPAREYAQALSLEQYAGVLFREVVHPLFHETFVNPKIAKVPINQAKVDAVLSRSVPEHFGYLDSVVKGDFLVDGQLSIADISVVSNLVTYQYIGFEVDRARFPRLAALFDRVVQQPAVAEALRREQPIVESMGLRVDFLQSALAEL
jgi:glutathione S-transferase